MVQANIRDLELFVTEAQRRLDAQVTLAPGNWLDWGGRFAHMVAARQRLSLVVPFCFGLIFLILLSAFNATRYALLVFTGVPLVASPGFAPMALTTGTGAEVQKPLATVVIGGLVSSTLLTLVVLPAFYGLFTRAEMSTETHA